MFDHIMDLFRKRGWYKEKSSKNAAGQESHLFELKLMGALRFLGRGEVFNTVAECCSEYIGQECFRTFTLWFCAKMASLKDVYIRAPSPSDKDELDTCMKAYSKVGLNGAIGSTDGVQLAWANAPAGARSSCIGKDPYPTLGFNCTVNHARRFLAVTRSFLGGVNDMTKSRYDDFLLAVRKGRYADVCVTLADGSGIPTRHTDAVYIICDGGYHK